MKYILLFLLAGCWLTLNAQISISGTVIDGRTGEAVAEAAVSADTNEQVHTDKFGKFKISVNDTKGSLLFSKNGYENQTTSFNVQTREYLKVILHEKMQDIEEVTLSTGYQNIPKERATGSFSTISNEMLSKQVTLNIVDRLPAVANGVFVSQGTSNGESQLMVRGLSTIEGPKAPLVVLDNFPYEGDIGLINPNLVKEITILKDAAAASIWGARAANGVIVITTKKGDFRKAFSADFNTSLSVSQKPALNYISSMNSSDFIEVEKELFSRGFYDNDINSYNHVVLSPAVALMDKYRSGLISNAQFDREINKLKSIDSRDQFSKYIYRPSENRQYSLNLNAGSQNLAWSAMLGYDNNIGNLGEKYRRLNLGFENSWKPIKGLTITTGIWLNKVNSESGKDGISSINIKGRGVPYMELADNSGRAVSLPKDYNDDYKLGLGEGKLLDWNYYPLTNWEYEKTMSEFSELRLNSGLKYNVLDGLDATVNYQYQKSSGFSETLYDIQSYTARNYINLFSTIDGTGAVKNVVPKGAIFAQSNSNTTITNLRGQLSYNRSWKRHAVNAILGGEVRSAESSYHSTRYYGYNANSKTFVNVNYTTRYPTLMGSYSTLQDGHSMNEALTRFVSFYSNAAYTFDKKYTISASARRDASNLFGLNINDQWNPFWSSGFAWKISNENFYNLDFLPDLKLRGSYGFNGNVNPAMVAVSTIRYFGTSLFTGTPTAQLSNFYNPELRWEKVRMTNLAMDFNGWNNRVSGSIEWYQKVAEGLFGDAPIDYTTGITSLTRNVAGMKGQGWDFNINTNNINRIFSWRTALNLSFYKDEITEYHLDNLMARNFVFSSVPISGVSGKPVYSIFAYKWAGLDPLTGDPQGLLNGQVSKDYLELTGPEQTLDDLVYFGSAIPTKFGNITNTFEYKGWALDVGISYKLGYWFRKESIDYTRLYSEWVTNADFNNRWIKPGDEINTHVPSAQYVTNSARDAFYAGSEVLIEKGDHVRLQYINMSYKFKPFHNRFSNSLELYGNLNNIGLLWKATDSDRDPDYNMGNFTLLPPLTFTLGLKANF
ncbi:SusC/RagA family TonB-linked outer membrane protein [Chryseobacterium sp. A321]